MIGRRYSDKVVQKDIKLWPFEVVNKDGKPYVKVSYQDQERTFAPEEISAMVLTKVLCPFITDNATSFSSPIWL